jgi:hypothetical protein
MVNVKCSESHLSVPMSIFSWSSETCKLMTMAFLINYQQHIDDLLSWYANVALSSILLSLNSMLPLVIGNLITSYLNPEPGKLDYRIIGELILEARLGNSFVYYSTRVFRFLSKSCIQS